MRIWSLEVLNPNAESPQWQAIAQQKYGSNRGLRVTAQFSLYSNLTPTAFFTIDNAVLGYVPNILNMQNWRLRFGLAIAGDTIGATIPGNTESQPPYCVFGNIVQVIANPKDGDNLNQVLIRTTTFAPLKSFIIRKGTNLLNALRTALYGNFFVEATPAVAKIQTNSDAIFSQEELTRFLTDISRQYKITFTIRNNTVYLTNNGQNDIPPVNLKFTDFIETPNYIGVDRASFKLHARSDLFVGGLLNILTTQWNTQQMLQDYAVGVSGFPTTVSTWLIISLNYSIDTASTGADLFAVQVIAIRTNSQGLLI